MIRKKALGRLGMKTARSTTKAASMMAGMMVGVRMYSEKIVILDKDHKPVAQHIRSYGTNKWIVDINHYIKTLMKKTQAIYYSQALTR